MRNAASVGRAAVLLAACALMLVPSGCSRMRLGRLRQPVPEFSSPLPASNPLITNGAQIVPIVQQRQAGIKSIKATMSLVLGGAAGRQSIDTNLFIQYPGKMRVRGSQDLGTVFDALVDGQQFTAVLFPERTYYAGPLSAARGSQVLAGIDPAIMLDVFRVDALFLDRAARYGQVPLQRGRGSHVVRYNYADGTAEVFQFREADLLIERYESYSGNQMIAGVTFTGYRIDAGGALIPSGFVVDVPAAGGQFYASIGEVTLNAPPTQAIFRISIPEGFRPVGPRG